MSKLSLAKLEAVIAFLKNNMKRIILITSLLCIALVSVAQNKANRSDINITTEIRPEVNYVTHLYTLAGLGFSDDEYTGKYGKTLPQEPLDTLRKYKDLLVFGQGEGGYLAGPFFFGVSKEIIANADSMKVMMAALMEEGRKMNVSEEMMQQS